MPHSLLNRVWDCSHPVVCVYDDDGTEVVVYCPEEKEPEDVRDE